MFAFLINQLSLPSEHNHRAEQNINNDWFVEVTSTNWNCKVVTFFTISWFFALRVQRHFFTVKIVSVKSIVQYLTYFWCALVFLLLFCELRNNKKYNGVGLRELFRGEIHIINLKILLSSTVRAWIVNGSFKAGQSGSVRKIKKSANGEHCC